MKDKTSRGGPSPPPEIRKRAVITGVTGQDGSYLAELLLSKGYEVHALVRRTSSFNRARIEHIYGNQRNPLFLYYGDLSDSGQISTLIFNLRPDEVYHLGAQSHVQVSFDVPLYTGDVTGLGTTRILEAIRRSGIDTRFYQASSSEMFGSSRPPQNEDTSFQPQSPYACAKVYSYWMVKNYREAFGIDACNGILFNHESPRRGPTFVTRKIAAGVARIVGKRQEYIRLGSMESRRDWGYAPEYVEVMWKMLQRTEMSDLVIGTGENHSVQEFVDEAFSYVGLKPDSHIRFDDRYLRPNDVGELRADPSKARKEIDWNPRIKFKDLVHLMIDSELKAQGLEAVGDGLMALNRAFPNKWWNDDGYSSFANREATY